jgi:hypothetical protein
MCITGSDNNRVAVIERWQYVRNQAISNTAD